MNTIIIEGQLVNLDKIHFVRRESESELLISFGTDYLRFRKDPTKINQIFNKLANRNEKFSSCNQ